MSAPVGAECLAIKSQRSTVLPMVPGVSSITLTTVIISPFSISGPPHGVDAELGDGCGYVRQNATLEFVRSRDGLISSLSNKVLFACNADSSKGWLKWFHIAL